MATEAYKLTLGSIQYGAWMQNEFYYIYDNSSAIENWLVAKQLVLDWITHTLPTWLLCMPASYGVEWISAIRTSTGGGKVWIKEFPGGSETGGAGTNSSSASTAPVIKLHPAMGVDTQGRIFLPAPAETMLIQNSYTSTYVTKITTMLGNLTTVTVSGRSYALGINSKKLGGVFPVSVAQLGPIIGNIKRRRTPR